MAAKKTTTKKTVRKAAKAKAPAAKVKAKAAKVRAPAAKAPAPKPVRRNGAGAESAAVSSFMTRSVHTIGGDQPVSRAHEMMNRHRIRHLPVLDAGELVGIVSQRDLYFLEALDDAASDRIRVEEAMTQDVFEVAPETPVREVARRMIDKKYGSAVVSRGGKILGVFTTIDALQTLLEYLPESG